MFDIFIIFAQNIDCSYTLEQPRRSKNKTNKHTPANPRFSDLFYIKVGYEGNTLHGHVFLMVDCNDFCEPVGVAIEVVHFDGDVLVLQANLLLSIKWKIVNDFLW